jgi:ABC-type oligopeptide transport system substrate-binding subunit
VRQNEPGVSPNAMAAVMPKAIIEKYGDKPVQEYVGTGPFMFREWKPDAYLRLVRWNKYASVEQPSEIQRLFYEDVVAIKVGDYYEDYVLQKKVQGFRGVDYPPYWNIWLEG